ncbi:MAG: phosphoenolpyruvate--protein phosphotransferase [Lentisphaerales bacterium]|nr:MAG: phosphoenolpyruvate--protein phosphotransferase [Lentisphaerales bacterium]
MSSSERNRKEASVKPAPEIELHGIGVSPGVAVARVVVMGSDDDHRVSGRQLSREDVPGEISRFENAVIETRRQIKELQRGLEQRMGSGDASILDAHLMVLDDRAFVDEILKLVTEESMNAERALSQASHKYVSVLSALKDDYLRERVADVKDIARRLLRNLAGREVSRHGDIEEESIVIAVDLAPSETAALPKDLVLGFATDLGSPTSHSAVMARGMEIPAVVGLHDITSRVVTGQSVLMDGNKGVLFVNPTAERLKVYGTVVAERKSIQSALSVFKNEPAVTKDGARITLLANIEHKEEVDSLFEYGAEGIGLLRTEYAYMSGTELPSEEELTSIYRFISTRVAPAPVIIRTQDFGGDKLAPYLNMPEGTNPFLGLRSIRFSLSEPTIFKTQLRAILRASTSGNVKIMYPMISSAEEVAEANTRLAEAKSELKGRGLPFDENLEVGAMIETPSAALTLDIIAPLVNFVSLGTNDLIQYTIAVDRVNEQVAYLYQPTHPAILRILKNVVDVAKKNNIALSVCGEMAADPMMCPLLVGLGINTLSVAPSAVPLVKDSIRSITKVQAEQLAGSAMECTTAAAVIELCRKLIGSSAPEIMELVG